MHHPELQRVLAPEFLDDLRDVDDDVLYERRGEIEAIESQVSFVRRLIQGRIDILCSELERRDLGGEPGDLGELIRLLPDVLASGPSLPSGRKTTNVEPDPLYCEDLDEMAGPSLFLSLPDYTNAEIDEIVVSLERYENSVSGFRRRLHDAIDGIQIEIARRYQPTSA